MIKAVNHGRCNIRLKGTGRTIYRNVYTMPDGKDYIKYYGALVEVVHCASGYATVEEY